MASQSAVDLLPRAIRKAGALPIGKAVVGRVVAAAPRQLAPAASQSGPSQQQAPSLAQGSQPAPKGGKGKKSGKGKKGKGAKSDTVLEIYLCGGESGADVILFEAWDEGDRARLQPLARVGSVVRVEKCLVVPHSEKTKWFTTSRAPVYLKALPETTMQAVDDTQGFPQHHPVTPFPSLLPLPPKTLVFVAGRVVPPVPSIAYVTTAEGEVDVPVAHVMLRAGVEVVRVSFWRDAAPMAMAAPVQVGNLITMSGVAKQHPGKDWDPRRHAGLSAVRRTVIAECPEPLRQKLQATPNHIDGATVLSPENAQRQRKDYSTAKAEWMTLSVLDALCNSGHVRDVEQVFQVPSVLVELDGPPTYMACTKCNKGWADADWPPCSCWPAASDAARQARWLGKIVLKDGTASLKATCFEAFQTIADAASQATGMEAATPSEWQDEATTATAMSYVGAVPMTVLITLAGDAWSKSMQATVQMAQLTYAPGGVSHPLKTSVHLAPTESSCPPCKIASTGFDAALGLAVADGVALHSFRALLKLRDAPPSAEASPPAEGPADAREVSCAFADDKKYTVNVADDEVGGRLREVELDVYVHALVSWESADRLNVAAFVKAPDPVEEFKKFFALEVELQQQAVIGGASFSIGAKDTPLRMVTAAEQANRTSPPAWKVRKTVGEGA